MCPPRGFGVPGDCLAARGSAGMDKERLEEAIGLPCCCACRGPSREHRCSKAGRAADGGLTIGTRSEPTAVMCIVRGRQRVAAAA